MYESKDTKTHSHPSGGCGGIIIYTETYSKTNIIYYL